MTLSVYDAGIGSVGINDGQGEGYIQINDADGNSMLHHNGVFADSLTIMVSYNLGSIDTTDPGPVDTTLNEKLENIQTKLYPNPASESIYLQFNVNQAASFDIQILNNAGQAILNLGRRSFGNGLQTLQIPVGTLPEGVYFVLLQNQKARAVQKVVIKR